jgi:hypothetical protein
VTSDEIAAIGRVTQGVVVALSELGATERARLLDVLRACELAAESDGEGGRWGELRRACAGLLIVVWRE